jgi:acyl-CoA synthetase (AMP-forming)/AMP-acid ligase II
MNETRSVYGLLARNLPERSNRTALIDADTELSVTYAGLAREVDLIADYLAESGVVAGDRVIVHVRKSIAEVAAMWGAAKIGAVIVNVNSQWTPEQLAYVAADCQARAIILGHEALPRVVRRACLPYSLRALVAAGGSGSVPAGFDDARTLSPTGRGGEVPVTKSDLAMIIYTSGSTGMPKGVMLTHANICIGAEAVIEYLHLDETDRLLGVLPYSFDAGLNQLTTMLMTGGSLVHQPVVLPSEIVRTVKTYEATGLAGVPPLWSPIVRYLNDAGIVMPSLRRVTNTGGKIPPNILSMMPSMFPGADIYLMYGLTEAFRSTYLRPEKFARKMGSIGQAIPHAQVFVVKHGVGLANAGEEGELVHAGPLVSMGYWQKPDLTSTKIRPCPELAGIIGDAPVVYSGDIVRIDEDGDLWFVGRMDDMIKVSGFRLSPTEVEDLISNSGMASDVVAFGMDDDDLGQIVHVAITPAGQFDEPQLRAYCRSVMPPYMIPRQFHVWQDPMPRTASGKLDRPQVIARSKASSTTEALEGIRCT